MHKILHIAAYVKNKANKNKYQLMRDTNMPTSQYVNGFWKMDPNHT